MRQEHKPQEILRDYAELDNGQLALQARSGDAGARNALFTREQARLGRLAARAKRYLRNRSWAYPETPITGEDIEQEAFLIFCRLVGEWEPTEMPFDLFVTRRLPSRLMHFVRDSLRPHRAYNTRDADDGAEDGEGTGRGLDGAATPTDAVYEEATRGITWDDYLRGLPDRKRLALTLRFVADMPSERIAGITGTTRRTVNRDLSYALAHIGKELAGVRE